MMKLLTALTALTILTAMVVASTVKPQILPTVGAVVAPPTATISSEELHRQVDMRTLPVMEIDDYV